MDYHHELGHSPALRAFITSLFVEMLKAADAPITAKMNSIIDEGITTYLDTVTMSVRASLTEEEAREVHTYLTSANSSAMKKYQAAIGAAESAGKAIMGDVGAKLAKEVGL